MKVVLTTLNAKYIHSSLALRYLKKYCKDLMPIEIVEFTINNHLLDIVGQIYEKRPNVIGFACYIWNIEMTIKIIGLLRKVLPETKIICGGPEVSYDGIEFLKKHQAVDYIVLGEGEETFYQLLARLQSKQEIKDIVGVIEQNKKVDGKRAVVVENLNTIPFPYQEQDMDGLKDKIIYYESSRGCPFSCQYCLSSATKGVRFFSIERVLKELEFFIQHNVRQVKFVDRTFNAKKSHYIPILKFLLKQECRTNFHFEVAVDLLDEEVLDILSKMPKGRVQLEIGIQSTNLETLESIQRKNQWEKIVGNVGKILSFHNIHMHLDLIVGLPKEDYRSFAKSFNDVYALKPHMLQLGFLKMLKGSGIAQNHQVDEYIFMDSAPYQVLANRYISYEKIRFLQIFEEVFELYYNAGRFRNVTEYLIRLENNDAFHFYEKLTQYWIMRKLHLVAHTTKVLYQYLYDFCEVYEPKEIKIIKELMKFDALTTDKGSIRPAFLNWNEDLYYEANADFWRKNWAEKYIKNYKFTTWRDIKKKYHIEFFSTDIFTLIKSGVIIEEKTAVLFSLEQEEIQYQKLEVKDFLQGDCHDL